MNSRDYKPLPNACVKNLCDKLFEKRKAGAIEVEQLVKTYVQKEKTEEIEKILQILGQDFIVSPNVNVRKGGLFGLASVAIGLGKSCSLYADALIAPIFQALRDNDSQIRYCACESLYNILKVLQVHALRYLNDLFEALCTATADSEVSVRQVVDHCDRLLRDIVIQNRTIDVKAFMDIISERLKTRVPFTRKFVVCWISTLNSAPEFKILQNIPQILDGLLNILRDENPDIRRNCDILLSEFLSGIAQNPDSVDVIQMINILISHCRESTKILSPIDDKSIEVVLNSLGSNLPPERLRQTTSLQWIRFFLTISTTKNLQLLPLVSQILSAVLPCLDDRDEIDDRTALKWALDINEELIKFVCNLRNADQESGINLGDFDCAAILTIIYIAFEHPSILTRLAALRWVEVLLAVNPEAVFENSSDLMPFLLKLLSDPAVEVVHSTVSLVGSLCKHPVAQRIASSSKEDSNVSKEAKISSVQRLFTTLMSGAGNVEGSSTVDREHASLLCLRFLYDLVQRFIADPQMLSEKGNLIITDLCLALGAQSVYYVMALIISNLLKPKQAFDIVQLLNQILLTQPSVLTFREFLHNIDLEASFAPNDHADLFEELYRAWCHNPVALLALCLLTQNYSHCRVLAKSFGDLTMSVEVLTELDRLIQLIESPVFAKLRLHLVDRLHSAALRETLYCLLMCLPQTEAFDTLRRRLQCLPNHMLNEPDNSSSQTGKVNFKSLLTYFRAVQRQHDEYFLREEALTSSGQGDGCNLNRTAFIPVELGFMQSNDAAVNPQMANSTQFLVKCHNVTELL
ncbi:unnamed protein product [Hymenolepis diminuta]|uniref:Protein VAC14 homolog n=3 Tax=Hymenolepis diminuta TaxID=6216 RepID=A0A0R3SR41_HYMDI|nr:unnamed protein product [Hymenolepis diminuta]